MNQALLEGSPKQLSAFVYREQRGIVVTRIPLKCTTSIGCNRVKEKAIKFILLESTLWDLSFNKALELR